jgi:hypothetical protein
MYRWSGVLRSHDVDEECSGTLWYLPREYRPMERDGYDTDHIRNIHNR